MNTATITQTQGASIEYNNYCQKVSLWHWYGYGWNSLGKNLPLWRCHLNVKPEGAMPILVFPNEIDPNDLMDVLYKPQPIGDESIHDFPAEPTPKPATRLEYYGDIKDLRAAVVYSYNPKYLQPQRYRVKHFGDGDNDNVYGCTCPAGIHGKKCKHVKGFKEIIDSGQLDKLKREPVEVLTEDFPDSFKIYYSFGSSSIYIGRVGCKSKKKARQVAQRVGDEFYRRSRLFLY